MTALLPSFAVHQRPSSCTRSQPSRQTRPHLRVRAVSGGPGIKSRHRSAPVLLAQLQEDHAIRALENAVVRQVKQSSEEIILQNLARVKGRGKDGLSNVQLAAINDAVAELEKQQGIKEPTSSGKLDGRWKLLYTTRPGTASPIQRSFIGVDSFTVYQDIDLRQQGKARVNNVVIFGKDGSIGQLKVEAEANTDTNPIEGFVPRRGAGLALFGKSSSEPPARKNIRIDFQFDRAAFDFKKLPVKIPYPVPFKLLGDETKGWIDITYLSKDGKFRLSRGNKGTLFILALAD